MKILKNPVVWIFLLALFVRLYKLGDYPVGLHVDEVKAGWNAFSILKTGLDDHLNKLSLYYNSFGDFRPTGIFYFTIPGILIFGRSIFAIRFPVAFFGALTVFPLYLFIKSISKKEIGIVGAFLLSINPWHIMLSRATNEVVISTFFAILALYFFIELLKTRKVKFSYFSVLAILVSYLNYHAIRFLAPLFFVSSLFFYREKIKRKDFFVWLPVLTTIILTIFFSTTKEGVARLSEVSIFKNVDTIYEIQRIKNEDLKPGVFTKIFDNSLVIFSKRFITEYGKYFDSNFLIGTSARPYRFTTPGTGLITYAEFVLFILGAVAIVTKKQGFLPLILLFLAPLPAAITSEDSPNMSRAFLMLPFLITIASFGLYTVKMRIKFLIITLLILNFSYFAWMYLAHSTSHRPYLKDFFVDSPTYRNVGTIELVKKLDGLTQKYDKIIITNFPDNPYPWYVFFTNKNPKEFNKTYSAKTNERDWGNIVFSEEKCPSDNDFLKYKNKNILVVDSWECDFESQIKAGLPAKVVGKILRPDGSLVFALLERDFSKNFPKK